MQASNPANKILSEARATARMLKFVSILGFYHWVLLLKISFLQVDVEFVTKVTNDICVKYFWTPVKFPRIKKNTISVKFADFRQEFSQINRSMFVFEYIIAQKTVIFCTYVLKYKHTPVDL